jgi:uncharacterized protein (DUF1778 family)
LWKKGGRKIKSKRINARVSKSEYEQILLKAEKARMNISNYVVLSSLGDTVIIIDDLKDIVHQIVKLGNNINQLTVLAHTGKLKTIDFLEFKLELKKVWKNMEEVTKKSGSRKGG